jgi:hypothetical protein
MDESTYHFAEFIQPAFEEVVRAFNDRDLLRFSNHLKIFSQVAGRTELIVFALDE